MSLICPTILASEPHEFRAQLERIQDFSTRIQIDLMDGDFAPTKSINPIQVYWPDQLTVDIHLMFRRPLEHIETLVSLKPNMVIIHAEADGDLPGMMEHLQKFGIKAGICLLPETQPQDVRPLIERADHVLLFAGTLGSFGGQADLAVLNKVSQVRVIKAVEIGWDGGANLDNVRQLVDGGIDVINVGGAIQHAENPGKAFEQLTEAIA
ncbi:MAG TPA: hypothetical protein VH144_03785 [Candidatus Saccharimonadales bacterium]|jgi:ribulose-phosphate 3-epimerase|nr:hypothetical protein [Candidatus Saccharimonadales bacterium]